MKLENRSSKMNGIMVLLLFGVFAVCVLGVLLMGANAYQRLTERDQASFERRTAAQYIVTRLHQADQTGAILVRDFSGEDALVLKEDIEGTVYETIVYCHGGYLCELFVPEHSSFEPMDGTQLMEVAGLEFSLEKELLTAELVHGDGTVQTLKFKLRSGRGKSDEE